MSDSHFVLNSILSTLDTAGISEISGSLLVAYREDCEGRSPSGTYVTHRELHISPKSPLHPESWIWICFDIGVCFVIECFCLFVCFCQLGTTGLILEERALGEELPLLE